MEANRAAAWDRLRQETTAAYIARIREQDRLHQEIRGISANIVILPEAGPGLDFRFPPPPPPPPPRPFETGRRPLTAAEQALLLEPEANIPPLEEFEP